MTQPARRFHGGGADPASGSAEYMLGCIDSADGQSPPAEDSSSGSGSPPAAAAAAAATGRRSRTPAASETWVIGKLQSFVREVDSTSMN